MTRLNAAATYRHHDTVLELDARDDRPTDAEVAAHMPATGDLDLEEGLPARVADALVHALCAHEELWGTVDMRMARSILSEELEAAAAGIVNLAPLFDYLSAGPDTQMAASRCCALLKEQLELLGFHAILPDDVVKRTKKPKVKVDARGATGTTVQEDGPNALIVCAPIAAAVACLAVLFGIAW